MHATDWFPTLLNLAGVNPNTPGFPLDGFDVWDVVSLSTITEQYYEIDKFLFDWIEITKNATSPRTEILLNYDTIFNTSGIRYQNWKLIVGAQLYNDWYPVPGKYPLRVGTMNE